MESSNQPSFYGLGIAPKLMDAIVRLRFSAPTPIQLKAIPVAMEGKDLIGIAQTGTGKTLAFGVPMLQRLAQVKGRGLVLLPTRELALQVDAMLHTVGKPVGLRTAVLIGGASMYNQIKALGKNPHVLIATPGRLLDHMEQKQVKLGDIRILVLDEADRMLDMGFAPQINRILAAVPRERQTMLFSATMPGAIVSIATRHMRLPVRVEVARSGATIERTTQEMFVVGKNQKDRLLEKLLSEFRGSVLVFTRTKHAAKKLARGVKAMGHTAADIHSNRSLAQRRDALEGFKTGKYRVLVATDIAARGIDVTGIELVVNYDLPGTAEDYVHRIGRTGRAGQPGHAIAFATPDQERDVRAIERLIRASLRVRPLPNDLPAARVEPRSEREPHPSRRPYRSPHRRPRGSGSPSSQPFGGRRRSRRPQFRSHF
jgi:ATP-dependent RNA helicase RhlE